MGIADPSQVKSSHLRCDVDDPRGLLILGSRFTDDQPVMEQLSVFGRQQVKKSDDQMRVTQRRYDLSRA